MLWLKLNCKDFHLCCDNNFNQNYNSKMSIKNIWAILLFISPFFVFSQQINTISPSSIGTQGGQMLIGGSNFGSTAGKVYFNGQEIVVSAWSNNIIKVDIPEGTGTNIPLQVQKSTGAMSNILERFSYDFPIIQTVTPIIGPAAGGTLVTLSGENFGPTGTSYVTIGGVMATIVSQTHTEINLITPAGRGDSPLVVWVGNQSDFVTFLYEGEIGPVLPLEWLDFKAYNTAGGIRLFWSTVHERNTAFFDIQRSKDGVIWQSLGQIESRHKGQGNYNWLDTKPLYDVSYYRLRQLDFDAKFSYSPTISIKNKSENTLLVAPNPTRDFVTLEGYSENTELTIVNSVGQIVARTILRGASEQVNMASFTSGIYYFRLKKDNTIAHLKVMKL